MLIFICLTPENEQNILGIYPGGDYPAFYIAGKILNDYSYDQLYNLELQFQILRSLMPFSEKVGALPNAYPPFFNLLFKPLALLPFIVSYVTWLLISALFYVSGILLLQRLCPNISRDYFATALLLAISFQPFILETWLGGQVSACGFFILSLAIFFEKRDNPVLSGFVMGFALYKPTLLLIILPFLLATRRYKTFAGFIFCAVFLALTSFIIVGLKACTDWFYLQISFAEATTASSEFFRSFKYVDFLSFLRLLDGDIHNVGKVVALVIFGTIVLFFYYFFSKTQGQHKEVMWASVLSLTTIVNLYMPIYDTIIIIIGIFLTKNFLNENCVNYDRYIARMFNVLIVLLCITPWFTQHIARFIGLQIFTLLLLIISIYQIYLIYHFSMLRGKTV